MKRDDDSLDSTLDRYMRRAGEPPAEQVASSIELVWERLRPEAEYWTPPARKMVARRSHFIVAAAVAIAAVAIGLYAAQRTGLLQAWLPVQQQAQSQVTPALPGPAVSVDPVRETVTIGGVAESKESVATSEPQQTAGVAEAETIPSRPAQPSSATVAETTLPQRTDGVDSKLSQGTPASAAPLAFEVASIRQAAAQYPSEGGPWIAHNGRFSSCGAWLRGLVAAAYDVSKAPLVKGGPDWIDQERFDIDARSGNAAAGRNETLLMLQTLLTERFKLAVHRSADETRVYTLAIAKNGSKLQAVKSPLLSSIKWSGPGRVTFSDARTLVGLINVLGGLLDVPVFDETGLNGTYSFSLEFTDPRDSQPRKPDSPPDLFTAVKEQLGLELLETRRRVPVIVIDHIEKPSPN